MGERDDVEESEVVDELMAEFLVETYEGLDRLDQNLVLLEETPDDAAVLTEVFRILHTIKGTCGFLGLGRLERIAHRAENLLSLMRDSVLEMNSDIANALLATIDAIRSIMETLEETGEEGDPDDEDLVAELERLGDPDADADADAANTVVEETPSAEASAKNADTNDETSQPGGDVAADTPAPGSKRIGDILVEEGAVGRTDVEIAATEQSLGDTRSLGKILVEENRASQDVVENAASKQRSAAESTIRVDVGVLDSLMNLVGELVLTRNQLLQLATETESTAFQSPTQRLNLITSELQEGVMQTRMQPIGQIWNKLPRVVRDLSQQFDKRIRLELVGKETDLDRKILEAIKDPLTHMVRNTADHGIESPEKREAAGKNPEGVLRLMASHEGGKVKIEISDDGAGIDANVIKAKAVEKGVITPEIASKLSDNEAVNLIFAAGFSTAATVSNVSGRGVGMDVVRTNIERIGGSVEISSEVGKGTTFRIKIPLTLAIIPALTVACGVNRFAIPQLSLQELVRIEASSEVERIESVHGADVYRHRGRLLPLVDLREAIGLPVESEPEITNIVVLQADGWEFGLIVDEIRDTEEIVVKPLGRDVKDNPLFSGATIMGDGTVALILDMIGLASGAQAAQGGQKTSEDDAGTDGDAPTDTSDHALLHIDLDGHSRAAVRVAAIDRLEEFGSDEIESSAHRSVVQYRGGIMPIVELGLATGLGGPAILEDQPVSVVVCSLDGFTVGLACRSVLDIVAEPRLIRSDDDEVQTAVIGGRVTDVIQVTSVVANQMEMAQ